MGVVTNIDGDPHLPGIRCATGDEDLGLVTDGMSPVTISLVVIQQMRIYTTVYTYLYIYIYINLNMYNI